MSEYIERKALVHHLENCIDEVNNTNGYTEDFKTCLRLVKNQPAADVAPMKHGKWIEVQKENIWNDIVPVLECSACGKYTVGTRGIMTKSNYCPNCGAKMDLED